MVSQAATSTHHFAEPAEEADVRPEQFLRRDQTLRFERNGLVYATDGRVGRLKQVVVDQDAGEISELVIWVEATGQVIVLPVDLVDKTGGTAVFLSLDRAQFTERAANAPAFEKKRFKKARLRRLRKNGQRAQERSRARAVATFGRDFIETPILSRLRRS